MPLNVQFEDDELPDLLKLLNRALNCMDPKAAPPWAYPLEARVVAKINDLKGTPLVLNQVPERT